MAYPKKPEGEKYVRQNISLPPELLKRIEKYCQEEERQISWVFQKATDQWLKERGF